MVQQNEINSLSRKVVGGGENTKRSQWKTSKEVAVIKARVDQGVD